MAQTAVVDKVVAAARPRPQIKALLGRSTGYLILAAFAGWLIWNLLDEPALTVTSIFDGLNNGVLYALIALGYTLVYGIIELINFAHGDLFMVGTLLSANLIANVFHQTSDSLVGWLAVIVAIFATMLFCGGINVSIEFLAYRRLRTAPKLAPLITAVGFSFILQWVGTRWNGSGQRSWTMVMPTSPIVIGPIDIPASLPIVLVVTVPLLLAMTWLVQSTKQGKAMRATAQDQDAARLMGINVNRTISFTFALGGALAGAAAVLYQQSIGTTRFDAGYQLGLYAFTAAVLGGIGNLTGAVIGGVLIGVIEGLNNGAPHGLGGAWGNTVIFSILILLMVFKPEGLLGRPTVEMV
jgi:branched-chain amino acid transport system permease protein